MKKAHRSLRAIPIALLALAAAVAIAACGGDENGDEAEAPRQKLTIYSGREAEYVEEIIERYEAERDVDVEVRYGGTAELASTIVEEAQRSPADLFFSQDESALGSLEDEGLLAELPRAVLDRVDARYRSATGRWVGTSGRARVVAYNKERVSEGELPRSILDFTDPKWKGRIGWAPGNGSFQAFVTALRKVEGEDGALKWLRGIVANDAQVYEKNGVIRDAIARGEVDLGFINHYYVAEARAEEGADYPVLIYNPPDGDVGSLVNVAGVGVLRSSTRREAAFDFVEFLLGVEGQRFFADEIKEYPLVDEVEADPTLVPLEKIEQPDVDLAKLDDLEGTLKLLEKAGAL